MPYHHFKGRDLNRSDKIQVLVLRELIDSRIPNSKRESSVEWEIKHSSSCIQIARILAEKRGLDVELAEIIAALHDISVIETGSYSNHAKESSKIAKKILEKSHDFSGKEIELVAAAIAEHSSKQDYSKNAYAELIKDADTLDCFLYDKSRNIYDEKPPKIRKEYFKRVVKVRKELGLPVNKYFLEQAGE
ncbi:MAG: HD domain-containing protein [Candidatus Diapherotrites archaeon]